MTLILNKLGLQKKARKRRGRGNASGHGTFSGHGSKGQRARSGGSKGLKMKGFRRTLMSMPKFKGMLPRFPKAQLVTTELLEKHFNDGATVNPAALLEKKLIDSLDLPVKILAGKPISKKFTVTDCRVSKAVADMIVKAGGEVAGKKENEPKK